MAILLRNVRLELDEPEDLLRARAARRLGVPADAIRQYAIARRSLDARQRTNIHFSYHLEVALDEPPGAERARLKRLRPNEAAWIETQTTAEPVCGEVPLENRPVIVGYGPAGMFAALRLAQRGYQPIVLERGREVRRRHRDVLQRFYREGRFDSSSNLLFGEGGAGTYSDGKLYTRLSDPLVRTLLETFYHHGADPDILVSARPHIGSDRLPTVCMRIREKTLALGADVRFESHVTDVRIVDGRVGALRVGDEWVDVGPTIFAIGHSARDTVRMLVRRGMRIETKPFQIGVRIEHPQSLVDRWQYGAAAGHRRLDPAEYHMVAKRAARDQGDLFSFCMCPGGIILPAIESAGLVATNGASRANRSGPFASSGLVVTMDPAALGLDALGALDYQRKWERLAFEATGGTYRVPAQRAVDFLAGRPSDGALETSYPFGGQWADVSRLIPEPVASALHRGLPMLSGRYAGFAGGSAIITAVETRASSPIRIARDPTTREALGASGFYPVGEGAGYAGGIVSAAIDGIKSADAIIERYAPPM